MINSHKLHYFDNKHQAAMEEDVLLGMAKQQGYVPATCRLGGQVVMDEIDKGRSPCWGCNCDRAVCKGKPKREEE